MTHGGVLLTSLGRVEAPPEIVLPNGVPARVKANADAGWIQPAFEEGDTTRIESQFERLPDHIRDLMDRAAGDKGPFGGGFAGPMNSGQGWRACEGVIVADTTLTAAAEAIMIPDFLLQVPGARAGMVGVTYKYTLWGECSYAITTPGTGTFRARWGGVAGTLLASSVAFAPQTAAATTTQPFCLEYWVTIRTTPTPTTGTAWCQGRIWHPGILDPAATVATVVTYMKNALIPTSAPAISPSTIDTSTAKAFSPTYQPSLATASLITHLAFVESLN